MLNPNSAPDQKRMLAKHETLNITKSLAVLNSNMQSMSNPRSAIHSPVSEDIDENIARKTTI